MIAVRLDAVKYSLNNPRSSYRMYGLPPQRKRPLRGRFLFSRLVCDNGIRGNMAKMFYTLPETMAALGRDEKEVKQLGREGRLREFRDGPRIMYKADQVDNLRSELGTGALSEEPPANWEPHPDTLVAPVVADKGVTDSSTAPEDMATIDALMKQREFLLSLEAVAAVLRKMGGFDDSNPLFTDLADRIMSNVRGVQYNRQKLRDELDRVANQADAAGTSARSLKQRLF